jgi:hypothetical protein
MWTKRTFGPRFRTWITKMHKAYFCVIPVIYANDKVTPHIRNVASLRNPLDFQHYSEIQAEHAWLVKEGKEPKVAFIYRGH